AGATEIQTSNPGRRELVMLQGIGLSLAHSATVFATVAMAASGWQLALGFCLALFLLVLIVFGVRYIPHDRVGIVEKYWSRKGSVKAGHIIAAAGEAGYQVDVLRGGMHFFLGRWQYRIHKAPLVTIPQGKIGYVYARDGEALSAGQTLARVLDCNNFQDGHAFLASGQRGRQRQILREGVYAINLALFVIITEDLVYHMNLQGKHELETLLTWQKELKEVGGFDPVVIGGPVESFDPIATNRRIIVDSIGIVTTHDGPSLSPGEIIA